MVPGISYSHRRKQSNGPIASRAMIPVSMAELAGLPRSIRRRSAPLRARHFSPIGGRTILPRNSVKARTKVPGRLTAGALISFATLPCDSTAASHPRLPTLVRSPNRSRRRRVASDSSSHLTVDRPGEKNNRRNARAPSAVDHPASQSKLAAWRLASSFASATNFHW